jgi:hypothetical protein
MVDWAAWLTGGLILANQVLSSTIVLTSFSLLIYLLTHNFRSGVARAFCALLTCVCIVYIGDVALIEATAGRAVVDWLKFQWIGIALVPAAYLDFSDALLHTTYVRVRARRLATWLAYAGSLVLLGLVYFSHWVVYNGGQVTHARRLAAGPLFWLFALFFAVTVLWGAVNIRRARRRCLTRASRRRMTYLGMAFAAPALGVFPYLMLTSLPAFLPRNLLLLTLFLANTAVLLMLILMAYSVAYFGALTPDRVVRHNLIHYLMRGPLVGAAVIFTMLAVPKVQLILGLPRDTVLIFAVVAVVVLLQLAINRFKPFIDRAIYRQDRAEITWIQTLDRRLLTSADLSAFLENTLAALCDLLRVRTGFVAVQAGAQIHLEAHCGDRAAVQSFLQEHGTSALATLAAGHEGNDGLAPGDGFWLAPLQGQSRDVWLGLLGVQARQPSPDLNPDEQKLAALLITRAQEALEDRYLQQGVFEALRRILPGIERLHRWQDATQYSGSPPMQALHDSPVYAPEFQRWVKEAMSHYWGGPKLTESPLLGLRVVQDLSRSQGGNPAHALRTVLTQAMDRLRPEGEQRMAAAEWLLYNILDLKFIRGLKVYDIARRLAMSESDLYRKQRVAIAEVAKALADLEQNGNGPTHQM